MSINLWGEDFIVEEKISKTKKLLNKINNAKEVSIEKQLKSKRLSRKEKLAIIKAKVYEVLGHYEDSTYLIKEKTQLIEYIDAAIKNGIIAIDTETNNSLDPLTCKLMGLCLYTPNQKQTYIPVNHVDPDTEIRLSYQLTEEDIREQLARLVEAKTKIIMHNCVFDYQVIYCTCGIALPVYWDSYIAARMLDENERSAGLKQQYKDKIDNSQEKYDIEGLFVSMQYMYVNPDVFALYAATDAYMTYKLYMWQLNKFENPELADVYKLFLETEMPIAIIVSKMTLKGISIDNEYAQRLSNKYHNILEEKDKEIQQELDLFQNNINNWKLTPEANQKQKKRSGEEGGKSKVEQLSNPISLDSPTQLAILLYDILKLPQVSTKSPRGTGVDELTSLYEKTKLKLCNLILEKRTLQKLINTFIDKIPTATSIKDNKIHCSFNGVGTDTGRFNSSNPSLQQIPAHNKEIRSIFCAEDSNIINQVASDNYLKLSPYDMVETPSGWVKGYNLKINDIILDEDKKQLNIKNIINLGNYIQLYFN